MRAVVSALRAERLTQGPRVEAFEEAFARALHRRHAVAVSSGTAALHAAIAGLRLPAGSEVITSPLTFAATANVLVLSGLVPRFADVDPDSGVLSPDSAAAAIGRRTAALLPVDYSGYPCDAQAFRTLARRHSLALLEDATHLLGGSQRGRPAGALADAAAFSLHPSKAIAAGEGGVVVTDDGALAERLRRFRENGLRRARAGEPPWHYEMNAPGLNYRLSDLHAALAAAQLRRLGAFVRRRGILARRYLRRLRGCAGLELPPLPSAPGDRHAWHLFVVRLRPPAPSRRHVFAALHSRGIAAQVHYRPVGSLRYYRERWPRALADCPQARRFSSRCLSLPLFPSLGSRDLARVIGALRQGLRRA